MTKYETLELGRGLGVLEFLLETTVTCYQGIEKIGCQKCPACQLRNEGIQEFIQKNPGFHFSYKGYFVV
jgi:7-cyano-7-deazaguanine synthase